MGPYVVDNETLSITENPFGWDRAVNVVFVDQPVSVGFSYSQVRRHAVLDHGIGPGIPASQGATLQRCSEFESTAPYLT